MQDEDHRLYQRGLRTLVASREAYAASAPNASIQHLRGAVAAVVPDGPERDVYNNAILQRELRARGYVFDSATRAAAAALAFDHDGDCGISNVGTLPGARRRGLATALTSPQLAEALARGCGTASLQSTQVAERVYAAVGFRDLGRFLEYVPAAT
jgi:predicted GNAT family acetyltransferase